MSAESPKLVPVKFLQRCANYNEGEVAGFVQSQVDLLVAKKIAVVVQKPVAKKSE